MKIYYGGGSNYYISSDHLAKDQPSPLYYLTSNDTIKEIPLIKNDEMVRKLSTRPSSGFEPVNKKSITYSEIQYNKRKEKREINKIMHVTKSPSPKLNTTSKLKRYVIENNGKATLQDLQQVSGIMNIPALVAQLEKQGIRGYRDKDGVIRYSI